MRRRRWGFAGIGIGLIVVAGVLALGLVRSLEQSPPAADGPDPAPVPAPAATATQLEEGSARDIFDEAGNLAMPMPSLNAAPSVRTQSDGTTLVSFEFGFDVANTLTTARTRADVAIIHLTVADSMSASGPLRLNPMYSKVFVDDRLTTAHVDRPYTFTLPAEVTAFLNAKGLASDQSAQRSSALRYIDVDVQHMRDFKSVDGGFDWAQGRAWTAADAPPVAQPVLASYVPGFDIVPAGVLVDDSTVTVTNGTGDGVYSTSGSVVDGFVATDAYATDVTISGQPVQCIEQGGGSNPAGFAMLNGWDITDDLPPGTIPPGASVTQEVDASESLGTNTEDAAENMTAATIQTMSGVGGYVTPGAKSAAVELGLLATDAVDMSGALTWATGVPIKAIYDVGKAIYGIATDSCASAANVFNLTAVEPSGAQASYSWGDQTDGLDIRYESTSAQGTAITDNVQLASSTGIMSLAGPAGPVTANPFLAQQATTACGTGSCHNNVIDLQWSMMNPCPQSSIDDCMPQASDLADAGQVSVPGTDLCGVDNELCPPIAAPVSDLSEVNSQSDLAGTEGSSYIVLKEWNPTDAVTALAADSAGNVYLGNTAGVVSMQVPNGGAATVVGGEPGMPIEAMAFRDGLLYYSASDGMFIRYDPSTRLQNFMIEGGASHVDHMTPAGNGMYLGMSDGSLEFVFDSSFVVAPQVASEGWQDLAGDLKGQTLTSLTSNDTYLLAGFSGGSIMRCELANCGGSWTQLQSGLGYAVQTMTTSGNTLYAGGSNGSIAQIQIPNGNILVLQGPGINDAQVAGMTIVDGALYVGGCMGIQSPVSGDLVGVSVLTGIIADIDTPAGASIFSPYQSDDCYNPSATVTDYKGFQSENYSMVSSQPHADLPAVVYVAFQIDDANFVYALENLAPATPSLCILADGDCPTAGTTAATTATITTTPGPPASSLEELADVVQGGLPQIVSTCGPGAAFASATDTPLITTEPASTIADDGFALTTPTSASGPCTTSFAWNLNDVGSFPYAYWSANAYLDASATPGSTVQLAIDGGSSSVADGDVTVFGPRYLTSRPADVLAPYPYPDYEAAPTAPVGAGGTQLLVPLANATALVLTITNPAGSGDDVTLDFSNDTLTTVGSPPPDLEPLVGTPPACDLLGQGLSGPSTTVYPLNDSSGVARDASGNGNTGLTSAIAGYDRDPAPNINCPTSGGMLFDGESSYVRAPDQTSLATTGTALTVVSWFRLAGPQAGTPRIVANDHTDVTGAGFQLMIDAGADGSVSGTFDVGAATVGSASWSMPLSTGQWHQYVGSYDGSTVRAYIDGAPVGQGATSGAIRPGANAVAIGYDPEYRGDYFDGTLANVAILPTALDAGAIARLYETATGEVPPPEPTAATCSVSGSPLAGRTAALWLLNDTTPAALDYSGNGNTATIQHSGSYNQTPGPFAACPADGALEFNGTTTSVIAPTTLDPVLAGPTLSVVGWFNAGAEDTAPSPLLSNGHPTVAAGAAAGNGGVNLTVTAGTGGAGQLSLQLATTGGVGDITVTPDIAAGSWYQVVGSYDGANLRLYVNDALVATQALTGSVLPGIHPLRLGTAADADGATTYFGGLMADVAIVPGALTTADVSALWDYSGIAPSTCAFVNRALGADAQALWLLDDTIADAVDWSGHGNGAFIHDPAMLNQLPGPFRDCPQGGSLALNGTSSYVEAVPTLNPATTGGALTVVSWFRLDGDAVVGNPRVVANDHTDVTGNGFQLALVNGVGGVSSGFFDVGASGGSGRAAWSRPLEPDTWYQYVGVYDGATVSAYLDGVLVGSSPASGTVNPGSHNVAVGFDPAYSADYLDGNVANVAIVPRALTGSQVSQLWTDAAVVQPTPVPPDPCATPTGYLSDNATAFWRLDDTAPVAVDSSARRQYAGTITDAGAYDFAPGPLAACPAQGGLVFDGTRTTVQTSLVTNADPGPAGAALTVIGWFRGPLPTHPGTLFANDDTVTSGAGFQLTAASTATGFSGSFTVGGTGGTAQATWTTTNPDPDAWFQFAAVFGDGEIAVYIDGDLVVSAPMAGEFVDSEGAPFAMGYSPSSTGGTDFFKGVMADVAVLDGTVLDAAQIQGLWNDANELP